MIQDLGLPPLDRDDPRIVQDRVGAMLSPPVPNRQGCRCSGRTIFGGEWRNRFMLTELAKASDVDRHRKRRRQAAQLIGDDMTSSVATGTVPVSPISPRCSKKPTGAWPGCGRGDPDPPPDWRYR